MKRNVCIIRLILQQKGTFEKVIPFQWETFEEMLISFLRIEFCEAVG